MTTLNSIAMALGASWAAGLNLYLTAACLGIADKMGYIDLPGRLDVLSDTRVIGVAVALYVIEFIADKIPFVDSIWDFFHTFIRPAGTVFLTLMATSDASPAMRTAAALICGTFTLQSHAAKAATRAAVNTTAPVPGAGAGLSLTEDAAVVGILWFAHKHPGVAIALVLAASIIAVWLIIKLIKFVGVVFKRIKNRRNPVSV